MEVISTPDRQLDERESLSQNLSANRNKVNQNRITKLPSSRKKLPSFRKGPSQTGRRVLTNVVIGYKGF